MKKRTIISLLLVACLATMCFVGGTFAKYTSTATGSDIATVAKWSIEVENEQIAVTPNTTIAFNLFDTINDTDNTADETDVDDNLIAPGTAGSFALDIENLSEVNAKYTITLAETNDGGIPLQYSVDGTTWKDSVAELTMTALTDVAIDMNDGADTKTIYWRWVFEGTTEGAHADQTDATDTALGIAARTEAPQVTIAATITVTQVD